MGDATQITQVKNRAVVRVKSCTLPVPSTDSLVPPALGGQVRVLHLGPGEWLVVSNLLDKQTLQSQLHCHPNGQNLIAVDLSCGVHALRIEGPCSRQLLSKGCGLDFHPDVFPAGHATRTRFAQLSVIVDCTHPAPCFELYVGRSYIAFLRSWLEDAVAGMKLDSKSAGQSLIAETQA
jgi:sarcosine oxidase subunit gamma